MGFSSLDCIVPRATAGRAAWLYLAIIESMKRSAMVKLIFESKRLICRRMILEDRDALFAVYSDSVAMRWVGDGQPLTELQCDEWYKVTQANYVKRGYGMFVLQDRSSSQVIGFCGLVHPGGQPEAEVKYALLRPHWDQGLASEAVPALLAYGASEHGLPRIIATVAPENLASQRVLEKAGMALFQRREHPEGAILVYEWLRPSST